MDPLMEAKLYYSIHCPLARLPEEVLLTILNDVGDYLVTLHCIRRISSVFRRLVYILSAWRKQPHTQDKWLCRSEKSSTSPLATIRAAHRSKPLPSSVPISKIDRDRKGVIILALEWTSNSGVNAFILNADHHTCAADLRALFRWQREDLRMRFSLSYLPQDVLEMGCSGRRCNCIYYDTGGRKALSGVNNFHRGRRPKSPLCES